MQSIAGAWFKVGATGFEPATSCSRSRSIHQPTTTFCRTPEGNRASVPEFPDINAVLCRKKHTPKYTPVDACLVIEASDFQTHSPRAARPVSRASFGALALTARKDAGTNLVPAGTPCTVVN